MCRINLQGRTDQPSSISSSRDCLVHPHARRESRPSSITSTLLLLRYPHLIVSPLPTAPLSGEDPRFSPPTPHRLLDIKSRMAGCRVCCRVYGHDGISVRPLGKGEYSGCGRQPRGRENVASCRRYVKSFEVRAVFYTTGQECWSLKLLWKSTVQQLMRLSPVRQERTYPRFC